MLCSRFSFKVINDLTNYGHDFDSGFNHGENCAEHYWNYGILFAFRQAPGYNEDYRESIAQNLLAVGSIQMTTHELARKLLEGPDEMVLVPIGNDLYGEDYGNCVEIIGDLFVRADVAMSPEGYWQQIKTNHMCGQSATILGCL